MAQKDLVNYGTEAFSSAGVIVDSDPTSEQRFGGFLKVQSQISAMLSHPAIPNITELTISMDSAVTHKAQQSRALMFAPSISTSQSRAFNIVGVTLPFSPVAHK